MKMEWCVDPSVSNLTHPNKNIYIDNYNNNDIGCGPCGVSKPTPVIKDNNSDKEGVVWGLWYVQSHTLTRKTNWNDNKGSAEVALIRYILFIYESLKTLCVFSARTLLSWQTRFPSCITPHIQSNKRSQSVQSGMQGFVDNTCWVIKESN